MLRDLFMKRFKSHQDFTEIQFGDITLLSGANSSGKSSILQALLLMRQTYETQLPQGEVALNGPWVSLGDFDDVRTYGSDEGILLGVTLAWSLGGQAEQGRASSLRATHQRKPVAVPSLVELGVILDTSEDRGAGIEAGFVTVTRQGEASALLDLHVSRDAGIIERLRTRNTVEGASDLDDVIFQAQVKESAGPVLPEVYACSLDRFIPVVGVMGDTSSTFRVLLEFLGSLAGRELSSFELSLLEKYWLPALTSPTGIPIWGSLHNKVQSLINGMGDLQDVIAALPPEQRDELTNRMESSLASSPFVPQPLVLRVASSGSAVVDFTEIAGRFRDFFTTQLFYLGPIREEPKASYGPHWSSDPTYVGMKGENTAFVLRYYGHRTVRCISPPASDTDWNPYEQEPRELPLVQAVNEWMTYLGLSNSIRIDELGKVGLAIRARVHGGDHDVDLTNVGVGVSQALPLIVLGLNAPAGSTLMFEQPELHLHPYVQSRLADFFVSLGAMGKQVIAETHSEHLMNRLRLSVAKGYVEPNEQLRVYFFTQNPDNGRTEVETVRIGQYGEIDHWPEGFFDETNKQLEAILEAAFRRVGGQNGGGRS